MASNKMFTIFILVFIGVIISLAFFTPTGNEVTRITNTLVARNLTVTAPTTANGSVQLSLGREVLSTIQILNQTNSSQNATALVIQTRFGNDGLLHPFLVRNDTANPFATVNVSYTANPDGFIDGVSGSMANLIGLFLVLGLLVYVIVMIIKSESFQNIIRGRLR